MRNKRSFGVLFGPVHSACLACVFPSLGRVCVVPSPSPFSFFKANRTTADLKAWQAWLQGKLGLFATKDYLERALKDKKERLKGMSHRNFDPKRVYITFQTEQAQRRCLKAVETGEIYARVLDVCMFPFFPSTPAIRTDPVIALTTIRGASQSPKWAALEVCRQGPLEFWRLID